MSTVKLSELSFKVLTADGLSPFQGKHWHLPKENGQPGGWTRYLNTWNGPLRLCVRGYHLTNYKNIGRWYKPGYRVFLAEWRGDRTKPRNRIYGEDDKFAVQQARLIKELKPFARESYAYPWDFLDYRYGDYETKRSLTRKWLRKNGIKC